MTGSVTPSARQAPRTRVVFPAPSSPETTTTSPGREPLGELGRRPLRSPPPSAFRCARRSSGARAAEEAELVGGRRRAASSAAVLGGDLLGARHRRRQRLLRAAPGSSRSRHAAVSFTAGVRSAAAGWKSGSRKTVRPPSSCACGVPRTRVIPVGLPLSSLVAKLPRVQTTRGSISRTCSKRYGLAGFDLGRLRVAIARRPRLEDVGDEDVLAREPDLPSSWLSSWPARPTNGSPWRSSSAPGASPTNIRSASALPAPKTAFVLVSCSGHLRALADLLKSPTSSSRRCSARRRSRLLPAARRLATRRSALPRRFSLPPHRFVRAHPRPPRLPPRRRDRRDQPPRPLRPALRAGGRLGPGRDQLLEARPALLALELVDRHSGRKERRGRRGEGGGEGEGRRNLSPLEEVQVGDDRDRLGLLAVFPPPLDATGLGLVEALGRLGEDRVEFLPPLLVRFAGMRKR